MHSTYIYGSFSFFHVPLTINSNAFVVSCVVRFLGYQPFARCVTVSGSCNTGGHCWKEAYFASGLSMDFWLTRTKTTYKKNHNEKKKK